MAKIYYSETEAATKLGISLVELASYVRDGKLRSFQDGAKKMYKVDEVDKFASPSNEIELAPVDEHDEGISLSEADKPHAAGKEDTVITAEGISIFDDEDLEIEAADPMAKTQIAPTLDEQVSIEGVGSGSGLLDLTRESDDTSLGEILNDISETSPEGISSGLSVEEVIPSSYVSAATEVPAAAPVFVEITDAASGAFNGMVIGLAVVMFFAWAVALSILTENATSYTQGLHENLFGFLGGGVAVIIAASVIGYFTAKSAAVRRAALQRMA